MAVIVSIDSGTAVVIQSCNCLLLSLFNCCLAIAAVNSGNKLPLRRKICVKNYCNLSCYELCLSFFGLMFRRFLYYLSKMFINIVLCFISKFVLSEYLLYRKLAIF